MCITGMKFFVYLGMVALASFLLAVATFAVGFFSSNAKVELIFVMIVTPMCMNAFQFWLTDNFIKHTSESDRDRGSPDYRYDNVTGQHTDLEKRTETLDMVKCG